ncbi:MAG TPA: hypothetical protein VFG37_05750 [Planctomycetota bacterium]|nr:hypothetical protein [Planctomycetota bacterium]
MKTGIAFVVAVALVAQEKAAEGVRFGDARLAKGAKFTATSSNAATLKTTVKGGGIEQELESSTVVEHAWTVAVTECDEKGAQAATLDVTRVHLKAITPLGEQEQDSSAAGVKWSAARGGDAEAWKFTSEGAPAPDDEAKRTLEEIAARALGRSPLAAALAGKRLEVGAKVEVAAADAQRMLATFAEPGTVQSLVLELTGQKELDGVAVATFAAKAHLETNRATEAGGTTTTDLEGELAVTTAQSLVVRASLAGPTTLDVKVGTGSDAVTIRGVGRSTWTFRAELR